MGRPGSSRVPVLGIAYVVLALSASSPAAGQRQALPYHELDPDPKLLALTPGIEDGKLASLLDRLEAQGLVIPLTFVGAGLVVLDAPGVERALRAEPAVREILHSLGPEPPGAERSADLLTSGMLRWWNEGFAAPEIGPDVRDRSDVQICAGAFTRDTSPAPAARLCDAGRYGSPGKVHYAVGRIAVNLVLPESEGPESQADWTPQGMEIAASELARGLNWWSLKTGREAAFLIKNWGLAPTRYEPGALTMGQEDLYIGDCLGNLPVDIPSSCAYAMVDELNRLTKETFHAHWACTQFILNANVFPGSGALAYAYLGGYHTVALLGNGPLDPEELDRVIAHEFGHIFQAADEYASGCTGCGGEWGYFRTPNGNCDSQLCTGQVGRCVMRGSGEYSEYEMHHMEVYMNPCRWTKEMAGIRDFDGNGILDVRETFPETIFTSSLPETLETSQNVAVFGRTWDLPYPSPPDYAEDVTVNSIMNAQFSISGAGWNNARPLDGYWTSREEAFEIRLPKLGGGAHTLVAKGINTIGAPDPTAARASFFVYDVILSRELEITPDVIRDPNGKIVGQAFSLEWRVNGEDFGSEYHLYRGQLGLPEELIATIRSPGGRNAKFRYKDEHVRAGEDYLYRLDVHIPGKEPKLLSQARGVAVLASTSPGSLVSFAPNPFRDEVLLSVRVPKGPAPPQPDSPGLPGEPDGPGDNLDNSGGFGRSDDPGGEDDPGSADPNLLWRIANTRVYDVQGRLVRDLGSVRKQETTRFNLRWDGRTARGRITPPGVYFVQVNFGYASETNKVIRVR